MILTIFVAVYLALLAEYVTTQGIAYYFTRVYANKLKAEWKRIEEDMLKFVPPAPTDSGDEPLTLN